LAGTNQAGQLDEQLWFTILAQNEVVNLQPLHNLSIFAIQNLGPGDDKVVSFRQN